MVRLNSGKPYIQSATVFAAVDAQSRKIAEFCIACTTHSSAVSRANMELEKGPL